jgi:DNA-binding CsgD family transcriptional regulator/class 3 adenylate cyclase
MLICTDSNERACVWPLSGPKGRGPISDEGFPEVAQLTIEAGAERGGTSMLSEIEHFLTTIPPDSAADRRLATVLVIGLWDSAALALRYGNEQWQTYRAAFGQVVHGQVQRFLGAISHELVGGVVATFDSTARAIRCAATIASAARQADLAIRAGIHVGELEWLESGPSGVAIEVANTIFEASGSGEILVSSTVRDLVAGSGFLFEPVAACPAAIAEQGWGLLRVVERSGKAESRVSRTAGCVSAPVSPLSRREQEVAKLVASGLPNRRIADELFIARSTVERHVANILNKLGFQSRTQIAAWAVASELANEGVWSGPDSPPM